MTPALENIEKPYKGLESFQLEDGELFFGRDQDAKRLSAHILSSRFTLLHAPSGVGKTSLLNAKVIPDLEQKGWFAVRILPENDPIASIRATTIQHLMPPPHLELLALRAASEKLAPESDATLEQLLEKFDNLPVRDEGKRKIISRLKIVDSPRNDLFPTGTLIDPFFCRLLRSSIRIGAYSEHLAAIQNFGATKPQKNNRIDAQTTVSEISDLLTDEQFVERYRDFQRLLDVPVVGLWPFFENLVEVYGRCHSRFALVIILDQFEELFTRFVDQSEVHATPEHGDNSDNEEAKSSSGTEVVDLPSYLLREELFEELSELISREQSTADHLLTENVDHKATLPIRIVISMRDEYIASLIDEVRQFVRPSDRSSFHLTALSTSAARAAIEKPARAYGYGYTDNTYDAIAEGLTREGKFVQPTQLQIVCEQLWNRRGFELSRTSEQTPGNGLPKIEEQVLSSLGGVKKILESYFNDFLDSVFPKENMLERQEALEMLTPLITNGRTRNIVLRSELIEQAAFRNTELRKTIFNKLEGGRIVLTEQRLGGHFVEITHEFLIDPILRSIRANLTDDDSYSRFRDALRELERSEAINFRVGSFELLSAESFRDLHQNYDRVEWPSWGKELMFRSAIVHGVDAEVIRFWAQQYANTRDLTDVEVPLRKMEKYLQKRRTLSLGQLWFLNQRRATLGRLSLRQLEHIVRSELNEADDAERSDIVYWMKLLLDTQEHVHEPAKDGDAERQPNRVEVAET